MFSCTRGRWAAGAASLACVLAQAGPVSAQLLNSGFEDGSLTGWTTFNNVISNVAPATITPRTGTHVAKIFGGFDGTPNSSGLFQGLPTAGGHVWRAAVYARHNSGDSLTGTANCAVMKIEFYRVFGAAYGGPDYLEEHYVTLLDGGSPTDRWLFRAFQATAPANAVETRITVLFVQPNNEGGAALVDVVNLDDLSAGADPAWRVVWFDEFNGDSVDASKWRVEDIHYNKNNELEYYAPDEAYVENGKLVLRSRQRSYWGYDNQGNWRHFDYTSGLVDSQERLSMAYGRIDIKAKLPGTKGLWPAHWMLPQSGAWPPEIDIMELTGDMPWRVVMSFHWGPLGPNGELPWQIGRTVSTSYWGADFTQGFHKFSLEWWPGLLNWYVDDVLRASTTREQVPQEPMYLILNTAVGGDWPGTPDGSTVLPQYHEFEYVRVYASARAGLGLMEINDPTPATATIDGAIAAGEYAGSTNGINAGFGDRIGRNSTLYVDSSATGDVSFGFNSATAWPTGSFGAVIYVDSEDGGYPSTVLLRDTADRGRRMASGKGSSGGVADLHFAPGFLPDYAICIEPQTLNIYRLGPTSHTWINGANLGAATDLLGGQDVIYRGDGGAASHRIRELRLPLSYLGVQPGDSINFVVTFLNGDNGYRTNEFVGVATGNSFDSVNPAFNPTVLKVDDFIRLITTPSCGIPGDMNCNAAVGLDDITAFVSALIAPEAYAAAYPDCRWCAGDLNADGAVDGRDVSEFVEIVVSGGLKR